MEEWKGTKVNSVLVYFAITNIKPRILLLRYTQEKQWNTKGEARRGGKKWEGGGTGGGGTGEEWSRDKWDTLPSSLQTARGNMSCEYREASSLYIHMIYDSSTVKREK